MKANLWQVVDVALWSAVPVVGTALAVAGMATGDAGATALGALVVIGGTYKALAAL
jgi:hypothetical protein